ncbi:hypothetical protein K437DRAFT_261399 [Tilletiaria anomala UBC 951]|uniref:Uncharacterized protein n=1 Tax=Tilletiaria anomala (strain ATCC 24038 / CBS 436.72 / UBC 951) TaxID=1037660 RepID=A0A066WFC9_TILAU|nr:uncharacterized protein K437DRAFT_261399 [Tilletiaria anomala UBC 951]KDN52481.1 hypothetical protein K437DRAFT_261399 [Tilletiaria anomala UBC 951]
MNTTASVIAPKTTLSVSTGAFFNKTDSASNANCMRQIYSVLSNANRNGVISSYRAFQGDGVPESNYSYAYQAAECGICTFRNDHLGTGDSEKPSEGLNAARALTEIGILISFLKMANNSTQIGGQQWNKVVLIGHSRARLIPRPSPRRTGTSLTVLCPPASPLFTDHMPFYLTSVVYTKVSMVFPERFSNHILHLSNSARLRQRPWAAGLVASAALDSSLVSIYSSGSAISIIHA